MSSGVQDRILRQEDADLDPEKIDRLAGRWNDIYKSLISWAASVRSTIIGSEFDRLIELLAQFVDEPIEGYRKFVDEFATLIDELPAAIEHGEAVNLELTYTLTISDHVSDACTAEINRLHQAGRL